VRNFSVESQGVIKKTLLIKFMTTPLFCVLKEIIKNASGEDWFLIPVKNHETIS